MQVDEFNDDQEISFKIDIANPFASELRPKK